jgi:hypothetical protein
MFSILSFIQMKLVQLFVVQTTMQLAISHKSFTNATDTTGGNRRLKIAKNDNNKNVV